MSWLKVDDGFAEHPKISELTDRSFRLHVTALCYCARNLTDGRLSARAVKVLAAVMGAGRIARNLTELVAAKVWVDNGDGSYSIYGYLEHNPTAEEVKQRRDERRAAGAKGAAARWGTPEARAIAESMAGAMAPADAPDPDPDPTHKDQLPVGNQDSVESEFHALRLFSEIRERWQTPQVRHEIVSYAHKLPASEFHAVIDSLSKNRRMVKDEGKYVLAALRKRLEERRAA